MLGESNDHLKKGIPFSNIVLEKMSGLAFRSRELVMDIKMSEAVKLVTLWLIRNITQIANNKTLIEYESLIPYLFDLLDNKNSTNDLKVEILLILFNISDKEPELFINYSSYITKLIPCLNYDKDNTLTLITTLKCIGNIFNVSNTDYCEVNITNLTNNIN